MDSNASVIYGVYVVQILPHFTDFRDPMHLYNEISVICSIFLSNYFALPSNVTCSYLWLYTIDFSSHLLLNSKVLRYFSVVWIYYSSHWSVAVYYVKLNFYSQACNTCFNYNFYHCSFVTWQNTTVYRIFLILSFLYSITVLTTNIRQFTALSCNN